MLSKLNISFFFHFSQQKHNNQRNSQVNSQHRETCRAQSKHFASVRKIILIRHNKNVCMHVNVPVSPHVYWSDARRQINKVEGAPRIIFILFFTSKVSVNNKQKKF